MEQRRIERLGRSVSVVGLGTWQLGADWGEVAPEDARATLEAAHDAGAGVVAFTRGAGEVLVAVAVRRALSGTLPALGGRWHDVLVGDPVSLESPIELGTLLQPHGLTVLERTG